ncbi:bifunctional uridylate/adenylate kinase [Cyanidiococcus yangmingshanensis]|uniref:Bifunctional uridylate/adenylate kinase n=1 Tax=Cyanidiococcus yangmingshanensis TaxID=2690220 RepID=A0A7J7IH47_9RHOD|nr:bifunctional uridylate/adenylate kinase [Cyanidiococcus yangmingshanensis]
MTAQSTWCGFVVLVIQPEAFHRREPLLAYAHKSDGWTVVERRTVTWTPARAQSLLAANADDASMSEESGEQTIAKQAAVLTAGRTEVVVLRRAVPANEMVFLREDEEGALETTPAGDWKRWLDLCGPADPEEARIVAPRSLRALFGIDRQRCGVWTSRSMEQIPEDLGKCFDDATQVDRIQESVRAVAEHVAAGGSVAKSYLNATVVETLTMGLSRLCAVQPARPLEWLGDYLRESGALQTETRLPPQLVFVLGGPGAGKGTQCTRIVSEFGHWHVSAGDLLRAEVQTQSEQGQLIDEMIRQGAIVPGYITLDLLRKKLVEAGRTLTVPGVLIDGFPRAVDQAIDFECLLRPADFCLFFECSEAEMERRLLERGRNSGRTDDNPDSIRKRFRTFMETTMPVLDYLERRIRVYRIPAEGAIDEVYARVRSLFL